MSARNFIHYKEYVGSVDFSEEDAVFYGKVIGIRPLLSFEGDSVDALTADFHNAVDEYLEHCAQQGKAPDRPYKGSFNVRVGADLHRKVALAAAAKGISMNMLVEDALRQAVNA